MVLATLSIEESVLRIVYRLSDLDLAESLSRLTWAAALEKMAGGKWRIVVCLALASTSGECKLVWTC